MDSNFVDLDILLTRIKEPRSKTYFLEAVKAYKAGALRASLTSVWVAVVYDIILKYRELANMGDGAATAFLQTWDAATTAGNVRKLLALETNVISDATTNTQLLSRAAATQLNRMREDRNLCAHPAFSTEAALFEPSPELARLHLVNAIDLVLAQEPLQGRAILAQFDVDVRSTGFPNAPARIADYVDQRYLAHTRLQNVRNFASVLAKSLLKGEPANWEPQRRKIVASLITIRDRTPALWPDVSDGIVRLLNSLDPPNRLRAIAFLAVFPDFWDRLENPTKTALTETAANIQPADLTDYRVLAAVRLPPFHEAIRAVIAQLTRQQLRDALSVQVLPYLWPRALELYASSGSFRGSEANFHEYIAPFAGRLTRTQHDALFDAIIGNNQNWPASETPELLLSLLRDTPTDEFPSPESRNNLFRSLQQREYLHAYNDVFALLTRDGWHPPEPA